MNDYDSLKTKINKIKELALRGVDGEKDTANRLLEELFIKYNLSAEDFLELEEEKSFVIIEPQNDLEKKLLYQIAAKYTTVKQYEQFSDNKIGFKLSKIEKIELLDAFSFYKKLMTDDLNIFFSAFIHKHYIFKDKNSTDVQTNNNQIEGEELLQMLKMMQGMKDDYYINRKKLN